MNLHLTLQEKRILHKKYQQEGLTPYNATRRINKITLSLEKIVSKLEKKGRSKKEINTKFKKEFEKISLRTKF